MVNGRDGPGQPTSGVVKQDKSSGGSVDTTKTRLGPQRVGMCKGERPIGAAKGKQPNPEALCQPPPPPPAFTSDPVPSHLVGPSPPPCPTGRGPGLRRAPRVRPRGQSAAAAPPAGGVHVHGRAHRRGGPGEPAHRPPGGHGLAAHQRPPPAARTESAGAHAAALGVPAAVQLGDRGL